MTTTQKEYVLLDIIDGPSEKELLRALSGILYQDSQLRMTLPAPSASQQYPQLEQVNFANEDIYAQLMGIATTGITNIVELKLHISNLEVRGRTFTGPVIARYNYENKQGSIPLGSFA